MGGRRYWVQGVWTGCFREAVATAKRYAARSGQSVKVWITDGWQPTAWVYETAGEGA